MHFPDLKVITCTTARLLTEISQLISPVLQVLQWLPNGAIQRSGFSLSSTRSEPEENKEVGGKTTTQTLLGYLV